MKKVRAGMRMNLSATLTSYLNHMQRRVPGITEIILSARIGDKQENPCGESVWIMCKGMTDDTEDFIIWAGLCEMLRENKEKLKGLE